MRNEGEMRWSTGSSCPLEESMEEACPMERGELGYQTTVLYNGPF